MGEKVTRRISLDKVKLLTATWLAEQNRRDKTKELNDLVEKHGTEAILIASGLTMGSLAAYMRDARNMDLYRLDRIIDILD